MLKSCYIDIVRLLNHRTFVVIRSMAHSFKIFSLVLVFLARFIIGAFLQDDQPVHSDTTEFQSQKNQVVLLSEFCCSDENETESESDDETESHLSDGFCQAHLLSLSRLNFATCSVVKCQSSITGADKVILLRNFRL